MRGLGVVALVLALSGQAAAAGNPLAGRIVFRAKCGTCHTLLAAGTKAKTADAGPVLTNKRETAARVMAQLEGATGSGLMPVFVGKLTTTQINDVVAFVVAASKPGVKVVK